MAATGYTPIYLYYSSTTSNVPAAGNLGYGELAINITDKNLFFKDNTNAVNTVPIRQSSGSSNGWLSSTDWTTFNNKQAALVSGTNIKTVSGTTLLGSGDLGTIGTGYGGTGLTSFTSTGVLYASSTSALATSSNFVWSNGLSATSTTSGTPFTATSATGTLYAGTTGGLTAANLVSTDGGASGVDIFLTKDSSSPADNDYIGFLSIYGKDDAAGSTQYGRFGARATTVAAATKASTLFFYNMAAGSINTCMQLQNSTGALIPAVYNSTTASAANVFVASGGQMSRSTSSAIYKTDVENLDPTRSELIYQMRPVWYRSLCENDRKDWSWYGLIAEEVAEIEPRLVFWGYADDQYDTVLTEASGQKIPEKVLKENAVMRPEGVQYDRLVVFLIEEMQKTKRELEAIKSKLSAIETKI